MLAKGVDGPVWLIGCGVNERPCLLDEFDQTALETQPLALERIGSLGAERGLGGSIEKRAGVGHALLYSSRPSVVAEATGRLFQGGRYPFAAHHVAAENRRFTEH